MALNIVSILSTTANLLDKHRDTINSGLGKDLVDIYVGVGGLSETMPIIKHQYPAICIELENKAEDFEQLGNASRRQTDITFSIIPITDIGIGKTNARHWSAMEIVRISQNIETIIREHITLSNTVDWVLVQNTDYSVKMRGEATYVHTAKINLKAKKRTT